MNLWRSESQQGIITVNASPDIFVGLLRDDPEAQESQEGEPSIGGSPYNEREESPMASIPDYLNNEPSPCRLLAWDSEFFQKRIARVTPQRVTEELVQDFRKWCEENFIDCLYLLATANDPKTIRLLEQGGFQFVDIRTTLETTIGNPPPLAAEFRVREARLDDTPALRAIAGVSHLDSRFYNDGHFPEERCRALYETWIVKSLNGWAQAVLVAELADEPVGYITCHLSPGVAEIGLFGVSDKAQGKGFGSQLIWQSLRWFKRQGVTDVTVVTQGRNVRAQRVYQKSGFIIRSIQFWYHYWPSGAPLIVSDIIP